MIEYNKRYRIKNLEKEILRHKEYRKNNVEKLRAWEKSRDPIKEKLRRKLYNKNNREKIREYVRKKYATDPEFKLRSRIRGRLYSITKNNVKHGSGIKNLGCTIEEYKKYLESKFLEGMSWDNWNYKGWHIDHIKPLSLFNLKDKEEYLKAFHYKNTQPMWSTDNHKKSNKYEKTIFN